MTEAEAHAEFHVHGKPLLIGGEVERRVDKERTETAQCVNCKARALFAVPFLVKSWVWCSHCGAIMSQLHGAFFAPDMGESPRN